MVRSRPLTSSVLQQTAWPSDLQDYTQQQTYRLFPAVDTMGKLSLPQAPSTEVHWSLVGLRLHVIAKYNHKGAVLKLCAATIMRATLFHVCDVKDRRCLEEECLKHCVLCSSACYFNLWWLFVLLPVLRCILLMWNFHVQANLNRNGNTGPTLHS